MQIEIFETIGYTTPTDFDTLLINLHKKGAGVKINKINIMDSAKIKPHRDVITLLKKDGLDVLPVVKVDGKLMSAQKANQLIMKKLG